MFLQSVRDSKIGEVQATVKEMIAKRFFFDTPSEVTAMPKKVLILGSGGLSIGQAGEFDYSGSQVRLCFSLYV